MVGGAVRDVVCFYLSLFCFCRRKMKVFRVVCIFT